MDRCHLAELLGRCTFPAPGTRVVCAVSGGADSTALLVLAAESGCEATAIHVDHGLRAGSASEAEVVARTARILGVGFRSEEVRVDPGPNLEARARAARYAVLPAGVMTGHTADDQAETVLLNLLRGAGLEGLAGMRPGPRHPILALRRRETEEVCRTLGLETVDDPSNTDVTYRRNRIRLEVLPLLGDVADRDLVPIICRQADLARDAADHLGCEAAGLDPTDARSLAGAPEVLARVAVRRWLRGRSPELHPPDAATVERVLAVARLESRATEIGGGWRVVRHRGALTLEPPPGGTSDGGTK